ncbi:MAG: hypothetical protein KI792_04185 [Alphaproteobacteria bacterium]|nr:hypothetical protein [Alphaproteobacteria bacterium SS10]
MSWKTGPMAPVISGVLAGLLTSAALYFTVLYPVSGTPLILILPVPILWCGFVAGINGVLIALIVLIGSMATFFTVEEVIYFFVGMSLPIAILVGSHDTNLWGERAANDPMALRQISGKKLGYCLCFLMILMASMLVILDLTLAAMGLDTLSATLSREVDATGLTPLEVQQTQQGLSLLKVMPAVIVITVLSWVLVNARLVAWFARRRKVTDVGFKFGAVAVPVWYSGLVALAVVVASQTTGTIGFMSLNAAIILALPGLLAGLGLVHEITSQLRYTWLFRILFYALIGVTVQVGSLAVVILVGLLDTPLGLRAWINAKLGAKLEVKNA